MGLMSCLWMKIKQAIIITALLPKQKNILFYLPTGLFTAQGKPFILKALLR